MMNNRLQALADEAAKFSAIMALPTGQAGDNLFVEKFAELIVRECIDCARGAGLADDVAVRNGLGFNDGISEAVTHMKKHFGVEE